MNKNVITLEDFVNVKWDCDICPLYPCPCCGFMFTGDCYDDVTAFWRKKNLFPTREFVNAVSKREEVKE